MFPFSRDSKDQPETPATKPAAEAHPLDALTGGAFSAPTSGERAARIRAWLATNPPAEQMQQVHKELSAKDKGAAKALRERLDEIKRAHSQQAVAAEWAAKAEALLQAARLNIADALAWKRDAARAGAPLSREPLLGLRSQLDERIKALEDLQQRALVQREAAALLHQRIELLSTKPWADADAARANLQADVDQWREQTAALQADANWASVDLRYPPQIEAAQAQLAAVWDAFSAALEQTRAAAQDAAAALPPVPVWADEIRAARGLPTEAGEKAAAEKAAARAKIDPAQRQAATKAVEAGVMLLEQAVQAGNSKDTHSAAAALRQSLKKHGRLIDDEKLEARVHAALVSAGELQGWQRWSADQIREQLVAKAEALLLRRPAKPVEATAEAQKAPETAPSADIPSDISPAASPAEAPQASDSSAPPAEAAASAAPEVDAAAPQAPAAEEILTPAFTGRKLQETLRKLREEWKAADQGSAPNHALWKRFDHACNQAHQFVEQWLEKAREESAAHKAALKKPKPGPPPCKARPSLTGKPSTASSTSLPTAGATRATSLRKPLRNCKRSGKPPWPPPPPGCKPRKSKAPNAARRSLKKRESWPPPPPCAWMPSKRCNSAGRPKRKPCRWIAATNKNSGTPSANRWTKPLAARAPNVKKPKPPAAPMTRPSCKPPRPWKRPTQPATPPKSVPP